MDNNKTRIIIARAFRRIIIEIKKEIKILINLIIIGLITIDHNKILMKNIEKIIKDNFPLVKKMNKDKEIMLIFKLNNKIIIDMIIDKIIIIGNKIKIVKMYIFNIEIIIMIDLINLIIWRDKIIIEIMMIDKIIIEIIMIDKITMEIRMIDLNKIITIIMIDKIKIGI